MFSQSPSRYNRPLVSLEKGLFEKTGQLSHLNLIGRFRWHLILIKRCAEALISWKGTVLWDSENLLQRWPLCIVVERCANATQWNLMEATQGKILASTFIFTNTWNRLDLFYCGWKKKVVSISQERIGSKSQCDGWGKETEGKRKEIWASGTDLKDEV